MTDERAIRRIEEILVEVTRLGGQNERTSIVSNLTVVDATPAGLTNFITIADERDGDTILAKTVPGVIYAVSDKVNVLFVEGAEPIAFQHGSESPSGGLWEIVPSTSTDIFYDRGDVGIGKSVAPDASLEILDTAQAQLRLTHTEDTKFVDLTLDTNHDLTITPSSTGQIILQPTTDSTDFFQVLDADGGTPILNVDSVNERLGIATTGPDAKLDVLATTTQLRLTHTDGSKFVDFALDTNHDLTIKPSSTGQVIFQPTSDSVDFFQVLDADGGTPVLNIDSTNERVGIGNVAPVTTLDITGTVQITDDIQHAGDTDTKIGFTDDVQTFTAGGEVLLTLTEAAQDVVKIGDGGDVDINFNDDMFLRGSDGSFGIATTGPDAKLDVLATTTQLRLTHTDGSKFVDFTLDTNHDLTITPSSTGQVIFQPTTDSADFFQVLDVDGGDPIISVNSTNERVGIGTDSPTNQLSVAGSAAFMALQRHVASAQGAGFTVAHSRNATIGSHTILLNNDETGKIVFQGSDGTAFRASCQIICFVDGTPGASDMPGRIQLETSPDGTIVPVQRMRIDNAGLIKVGDGSTISAQLHIDQASTTAALPVALFDQADVSEEMFEFVSTIGVGNAIEAVGAKTLTVTHFIKVTLPGGLTRYLEVGTIA